MNGTNYNSTILLLDEKTNFFSTDNIRTYVFPLLETLLFSTLTRKSPGYTECSAQPKMAFYARRWRGWSAQKNTARPKNGLCRLPILNHIKAM